MMYDILIFTFSLSGLILVTLSFSERNPDRPLFSSRNPALPWKWRPLFRSRRGYRLAFTGACLMSASGLVGLVRMIVRFLS